MTQRACNDAVPQDMALDVDEVVKEFTLHHPLQLLLFNPFLVIDIQASVHVVAIIDNNWILLS